MFAALGRDIGKAAAAAALREAPSVTEAGLRGFVDALLERGLVVAERTDVKLDRLPHAVARTRWLSGQRDYKCAWGVAGTFMRGGEPG